MKFKVLLIAFTVIAALSSNAQTEYTFSINNHIYKINEDDLDQHFGIVFNELINSGSTKQKYFELWSTSYQKWKELAKSYPMSWRMYGDNVAEFKRTGSTESIELSAKGNVNKAKNHAGRMAVLNRMICGSLSKARIK